MNIKAIGIGLGVLTAIFLAAVAWIAVITPVTIISSENPNAGTWEDDPLNWSRAFGHDLPAGVSVVHSYYWESNHFTHEYIYFFEVQSSDEWRDAFLKQRKVVPVAPSVAWSFRKGHGDNNIPKWFAPDPVDNYNVFDIPKYYGSIWINKSNKHIHFYGSQL